MFTIPDPKTPICGAQGGDIFYAVEQTDCITRQLKQCCPDCAAWNVDLLPLGCGMRFWPTTDVGISQHRRPRDHHLNHPVLG